MRLAVDNLADAVTIHDATGNLLYANEATARMMGMTLDEVLSAAPGSWTEHFAMYDENGRELPHRLVDVLRSGPVKSAAELVERLDRALLDFQGSEQRDDVAVLVLRRER